ncbi:MAG: hypothetical protein B6247_07745 [Candidatus Parabeggiatoa sp. nov. 2]|nr:MAG: hypothetical protein B6247_07745 [Beggiatoa sp. 4572_84]
MRWQQRTPIQQQEYCSKQQLKADIAQRKASLEEAKAEIEGHRLSIIRSKGQLKNAEKPDKLLYGYLMAEIRLAESHIYTKQTDMLSLRNEIEQIKQGRSPEYVAIQSVRAKAKVYDALSSNNEALDTKATDQTDQNVGLNENADTNDAKAPKNFSLPTYPEYQLNKPTNNFPVPLAHFHYQLPYKKPDTTLPTPKSIQLDFDNPDAANTKIADHNSATNEDNPPNIIPLSGNDNQTSTSSTTSEPVLINKDLDIAYQIKRYLNAEWDKKQETEIALTNAIRHDFIETWQNIENAIIQLNVDSEHCSAVAIDQQQDQQHFYRKLYCPDEHGKFQRIEQEEKIFSELQPASEYLEKWLKPLVQSDDNPQLTEDDPIWQQVKGIGKIGIRTLNAEAEDFIQPIKADKISAEGKKPRYTAKRPLKSDLKDGEQLGYYLTVNNKRIQYLGKNLKESLAQLVFLKRQTQEELLRNNAISIFGNGARLNYTFDINSPENDGFYMALPGESAFLLGSTYHVAQGELIKTQEKRLGLN